MARMAVIVGLRLSFYILLQFRFRVKGATGFGV